MESSVTSEANAETVRETAAEVSHILNRINSFAKNEYKALMVCLASCNIVLPCC